MDACFVGNPAFVALVPILVQNQDVEPLLRIGWGLESNLPVLEGPVQALISDVAKTIEGDLATAFSHEHRLDDDVLEVLRATEVVHEGGYLQQVRSAEVALPARIVVVAVDHEHGGLHIDIRVLVVYHTTFEYRLVTDHLEANVACPKKVSSEEVHCAVQTSSGGFVVMEQISAMQNEVHLFGLCDLKHFFERCQRIIPTNLVLFIVPDMSVRGDQESECVLIIFLIRRNSCCPCSGGWRSCGAAGSSH
mmetsp:Transcript_74358/g.155027  ORF Transcript_74358/g.155027 Transcript_74358/m.155027 type:complete len:249 (-) Transcript_74358:37-783(-)